MIYLDPSLTIAEAAHIAKLLDCKLIQDHRGNVRITPVGCVRKQHRNNVIPFSAHPPEHVPPVDFPRIEK